MAAKDVFASAIVAAAVAAGTTYAIARTGILRETVDVPSIVGLPLESARQLIERTGLLLMVTAEREDAKAPPGQIIAQSPLNGSKVARGASLSVVISKAPAMVSTPSVIGQPIGEAKLRLQTSQLSTGEISEKESAEVPAGSVISQSVATGSEVKVGTTVDLVVSKGQVTIPIPKLIGRSVTNAKKEIEKAGFTVGKIRYKTDEDEDEGIVLWQSPEADKPAVKGTAVEIIVNAY